MCSSLSRRISSQIRLYRTSTILATSKDTLSLKYYYQHDPTTAPFGFSSVEGFNQHLDAGSQVASITNTQSLSPNFSIAEVFGFIREKIYSTHWPALHSASRWASTLSALRFSGNHHRRRPGECVPDLIPNVVFNAVFNVGSTAASQGAFTGIFQNRWMPSADASWMHGKHTVTFGGSFSYTQLNARDERTNSGMIGFSNFADFLQGLPITYTADGFIATTFLQGDANRYYRSRETGGMLRTNFRSVPTSA